MITRSLQYPIDKKISRVFAAVQIPLLFFVMLLHTPINADINHPLFWIGEFLNELGRITASCFFFISGYLIFARLDSLSASSYLALLRKRFFSLFIPYIVWICIPYIISKIQGADFPCDPFSEPRRFFFSNHPHWYSQPSLLGYSFTIIQYPIGNFVLWYVRDLIEFIILTPIFYLLLKATKKAMTPICIIAMILNIGFGGWQSVDFWPYLLGCSLAFNRTGFLSICRRYAPFATLLWLLLATASIYDRFITHPIAHPSGLCISRPQILLLNSSLLCGGIVLFGWTCRLVERSDAGHKHAANILRYLLLLAPASFFIYVAHEIPIFRQLRNITDHIVTNPDWQPYVSYFSYNIIRLALLLAIFFLLSRFMPRTMSIITGHRSARAYAPAAVSGAKPSQSASNGVSASSAPGLSDTRTPGET